MQSKLPMHLAKRCHAYSKRTGKPCQAPAVKGWKVCRMHGARGGAPVKTGLYMKETKALQAEVNQLIAQAKAMAKSI